MRRLLGLLLVAAALTGCSPRNEAGPPAPAEETENIDRGDFLLRMEPARGKLGSVESRLRDWPIDQLISDLNDWLALPDDIEVVLASTERPNDFYFDPEIDKIVVSYEAVDRDRKLFAHTGDDRRAWDRTLTTFEFFVYHQVGHALADVLELPITGKEEDGVDAFVALLVVEVLEDEEILIRGVMEFADALASSGRNTRERYDEEHFVDDDRLHRFLCWVYGSDTEQYSWIVGDEHLPVARAERCEDDYEQNVASWVTLLGENLKAAR